MVSEQAAQPLDTGPEFHWKDGWFFARVTELGQFHGAVRLRHEKGGTGLTLFIPAGEWASIVAAVTPEGDNATTYRLAAGLHDVGGGRKDV